MRAINLSTKLTPVILSSAARTSGFYLVESPVLGYQIKHLWFDINRTRWYYMDGIFPGQRCDFVLLTDEYKIIGKINIAKSLKPGGLPPMKGVPATR